MVRLYFTKLALVVSCCLKSREPSRFNFPNNLVLIMTRLIPSSSNIQKTVSGECLRVAGVEGRLILHLPFSKHYWPGVHLIGLIWWLVASPNILKLTKTCDGSLFEQVLSLEPNPERVFNFEVPRARCKIHSYPPHFK